jgi:hypothetical protein
MRGLFSFKWESIFGIYNFNSFCFVEIISKLLLINDAEFYFLALIFIIVK